MLRRDLDIESAMEEALTHQHLAWSTQDNGPVIY